MSYLTDGVHLYENLGACQNFGLAGGNWLTVRDCRTDTVRTMCQLEQALCEPVPGARPHLINVNAAVPARFLPPGKPL